MIMNMQKQPPILDDLRNHSQEELAELRAASLLNGSAPANNEDELVPWHNPPPQFAERNLGLAYARVGSQLESFPFVRRGYDESGNASFNVYLSGSDPRLLKHATVMDQSLPLAICLLRCSPSCRCSPYACGGLSHWSWYGLSTSRGVPTYCLPTFRDWCSACPPFRSGQFGSFPPSSFHCFW